MLFEHLFLCEFIFVFQSLLKAKPPITEDDFKEDFQRQVRVRPGHISDEDDDDEEEKDLKIMMIRRMRKMI